MLTADHMIAAVHNYVTCFDKADPEAIVAMFAEDASVEDPVGTALKVGHDAIREFYVTSVASGAKLVLQGPIRVGENFAAFAFQARLEVDGNTMAVDVIDVFRFNPDGKIATMQAYFGPTNFGAA